MPLLLLLCILAIPGLAPAQTIPTPESILGNKPGADFYLASYDDVVGYLKKLEAASPKLRMVNVGKTTRGVDTYIAVISSAQNLQALDRHKDIARRLANGRLSPEEARAFAKEGRAIIHIDGGLHSTEVAGGQHVPQLAYNLVCAQGDAQIDRILDNVILMLWPTLNPDGQNMVVNWYRRNVGTPYEVSPLPELYQEYVGHDNNRDGYMLNMIESRNVTRATLDFEPLIFYCHHQTAPFPARIWIPPFAEPISGNLNPIVSRWLNVIGVSMAAYLDAHQMPGAMHRGRFDNWYPGFLDFTHIFRHTVSFFTETALYNYATPHFYTVNDFPKPSQELRGEVFYSSPWKGGWWRLGDAVRYNIGSSMSVLDTAARYREEMLLNRWQAGRETIEKFTTNPPFAYVIPRDSQRDPATAAQLVQRLLWHGIEVHEVRTAFAANGVEYPAGAWVVLMDQPFAGLVKELFEVQNYPDLRETESGPPVLPYDVSGWTLPMQMGVETAAVLMPVQAQQRANLARITEAKLPDPRVTGAGPVFTLPHERNGFAPLLNDALAAGASASFAGPSVVLSKLDAVKAGALARQYSVPLTATSETPAKSVPVKRVRVGIYTPFGSAIDSGWTRWLLEQNHFAPIVLRNDRIRAGHLKDSFDTIVLPDARSAQILEGQKAGTVPGEFAGGVGIEGVEALRAFVQAGGTLVAFNNAALFAIEQLNLPVTNVLAGLKNEQFFCAGALLRLELGDAQHPVNLGMPSHFAGMFERGPAFETKAGFQGTVLASYPKTGSPLASGYVLHGERLNGKAAALEVQLDKGRVVLFGFRPQWRGQSHGTYKMVFNSLYFSSEQLPAKTSASQVATSSPVAAAWTSLAQGLRTDVARVLDRNKAFHAAKGTAALEQSAALTAAIEETRRTRIAAIDEFRQNLEDKAAARKVSEYLAQARRMLAELQTKTFGDAASADSLLEEYKLASLDKDVAKLIAGSR